MADTQTEMQPPSDGPPVALAFAGDDIEELGERIMELTLREAVQLTEYLKSK